MPFLITYRVEQASSWLKGGEKSGGEKSGVEKFGDEMSCNHSEAFYYCDQLGGALAEPTNNLRQAVLAGLASDLAIDPGLDHWWIGKYNYCTTCSFTCD